jgi:hypothetical protein
MKTTLAVVLAVLAAATICRPAQADPNQANLEKPFSEAAAPFVGSWQAHGESLRINPDGTGTEVYSGGTVHIKMTFVSTSDPNHADGNIVSGGNAEPGSWVTMDLFDNGNGVKLSMSQGDQQFPFCKMISGRKINSADCGA